MATVFHWLPRDCVHAQRDGGLSPADALFRAADGVFASDASQRITFWSAASERLLGISKQQALGAPCHKLIRACDGAGRLFCGTACRIAQLAGGGSAPATHRLWLDAGGRNRQQFRVHVVLAPSANDGTWNVFHVLHRVAHSQQTNADVARAGTSRLTARERIILQMLAEGLSASHISRSLCISHATVRNHIQHVLAKLRVHSKTEAVALAYRQRLVAMPVRGAPA